MLLTIKEVAKQLNVKPGTVYGWIREGRIKAKKVGPKLWRIPSEEIDTMLK